MEVTFRKSSGKIQSAKKLQKPMFAKQLLLSISCINIKYYTEILKQQMPYLMPKDTSDWQISV